MEQDKHSGRGARLLWKVMPFRSLAEPLAVGIAVASGATVVLQADALRDNARRFRSIS